MSQVTVEINGKKLSMVFGMKMLTSVGEHLGLETIEEVLEKVNSLAALDGKAPIQIKLVKFLWVIIYKAIVCVPGQEDSVTISEIENLQMSDLTAVAGRMSAGLAQSFPHDVSQDDQAEDAPVEEKKS